ncbi:MAG: hypothetical protein AB8C02_14425, partial [Halioglobus sp.]
MKPQRIPTFEMIFLRRCIALLTLIALIWSPATLSSIDGLTHKDSNVTFDKNDAIPIFRGWDTEILVRMPGSTMATVTGVDAFSSNGARAPGFTAKVVRRNLAQGLLVNLKPGSLVPVGEYRIRLRFPVQVGAPTEFKVSVIKKGQINSTSWSPVPSHGSSTMLIGESYTVTVSGSGLSKAKLKSANWFSSYQLQSRSDTSMVFSIRASRVGSYEFSAADFYHEGPLESWARNTMNGNGARAYVMFNPKVNQVSPSTVSVGSWLELNGSNLSPGTNSQYAFDVEYIAPHSGQRVTLTQSEVQFVNDQKIRIKANSQMGPLRISYDRIYTTGTKIVYPIEQNFSIAGTNPHISSIAPVSGPSVGSSGLLKVLTDTSRVRISGSHLIPAGSERLAVTFDGQAASVINSSYNASTDTDTVEVRIPDLRTPRAGIFKLTKGGKSTTTQKYYYVPPPSGVRLRDQAGTFTTAVEASGTSPGPLYRLRGNNVCAALGSTSLGTPHVQLGLALLETLMPTSGGCPSEILVRIPAQTPLGTNTLSVRHEGGSFTVGSIEVVPPGAQSDVTIASLQLTQSTFVAGTPITGTVTVTAPPPPNSFVQIGNSAYPQYFESKNVPLTGTTTAFSLQSYPMQHATLSMALYAITDNSKQANFFLVAPPAAEPTRLTLSPTSTRGGNEVRARLKVSQPSVVTSIALSSSDHKVATVPATIEAGGNQGLVQFRVKTRSVSVPKTVTITATSNGVSKQATLRVDPAPTSIRSLSLSANTLIGGQTTKGHIELDGLQSKTMRVSLKSSDTQYVRVPASIQAINGKATFQVSTSRVTS